MYLPAPSSPDPKRKKTPMNKRVETPLVDTGDGPVQWVAECEACAVNGSVVMVFETQAERVDWASSHRKTLGHEVLEYQRRHPPVQEYPQLEFPSDA